MVLRVEDKVGKCMFLRMCTCVGRWGVVSVCVFFPFAISGPIPLLLCCLGHAPELRYNSNYNGFDSLVSIVRKGAVTEISKFCQQLSSEVVGAQAGTGGVNRDDWGFMQSTKSLNSRTDL